MLNQARPSSMGRRNGLLPSPDFFSQCTDYTQHTTSTASYVQSDQLVGVRRIPSQQVGLSLFPTRPSVSLVSCYFIFPSFIVHSFFFFVFLLLFFHLLLLFLLFSSLSFLAFNTRALWFAVNTLTHSSSSLSYLRLCVFLLLQFTRAQDKIANNTQR